MQKTQKALLFVLWRIQHLCPLDAISVPTEVESSTKHKRMLLILARGVRALVFAEASFTFAVQQLVEIITMLVKQVLDSRSVGWCLVKQVLQL